MPFLSIGGIIMVILYLVLGIAAIVFAFRFNVWLGIGVIAAFILYGIYRMLPSYYVMQGNKAFAAGDEEATYLWYKKAYDTGRTKVKMKTSYAYILMRTGRVDEAEKVLDPIIRVKRLEPEKKNPAKIQRCMVYYKQGRLDEAISDAQELLDSGYKNSNLYGLLGYLKILRNDPMDETLALCEEAYDYNSDNRDIVDNLTLCYYKQGRYEEAEKLSDEIVKNHPDFTEGYYHGAQIAMKLNKRDKAKEYLDKIGQCKRSSMTTVSEEEIAALREEVNA